jgi:hypothetical protein
MALALLSGLIPACGSKPSAPDLGVVSSTPEGAGKPAKAILQGSAGLVAPWGVSGWALDKNQPNTPIRVDIYDGTELVATILANEYREAVAKLAKDNGKHGFEYRFPVYTHDGLEHTIAVKFAGTNIDLNHSPKTIVLPLPAKAPDHPPATKPPSSKPADK